MKKIISFVLIVATLFAMFTFVASAAKSALFTGTFDGTYCECRLKDMKKSAYVTVTVKSSGPVTIRMTDENNRYIWGEDYAIAISRWGSGSRKFHLGNDHSVYRLQIRGTNGSYGHWQVSSPKNCTIK